MTSQGLVSSASLKQAHKEDIERYFLSAYISKISVHPSLNLLTVHGGTPNRMMLKFDHDSHRLINKRFGVEECWSYINEAIQFS